MGHLPFTAMKLLKQSVHLLCAAHTPNIFAVADKLSGGVAHTKQLLVNHAQQCIHPGIDYFNRQVSTTLQRSLSVFKAARYFCPQKMYVMQPSASSLDSLKAP